MASITISKGTAIKRLNRAMAHDYLQVKTTRSYVAYLEFGDHYVIDFNRNFIADHHVDIEALAKEWGVLRPFERVEAN